MAGTDGLAPKDLRVFQLRTGKAALNSPLPESSWAQGFSEAESPMAPEYSPRQVTCAWCFLTQNSLGQFFLLLGSLHLPGIDRWQVRRCFLRMVAASLPYGSVTLMNRQGALFNVRRGGCKCTYVYVCRRSQLHVLFLDTILFFEMVHYI